MNSKNNDKFSVTLNETNDFFKEQYGLNITGEDAKSILTDDDMFNSYKGKLTENFDPQLSEQLDQLMDNTRQEILNENLTSGITPFASLTMPMLVKLWARLTMTNVFPTQPVDVPAFTVSWMKPFIMGHDGEKYYLPDAINSIPKGELVGMRQLKPDVALTAGKVSDYDLFTGIDSVDRAKGDSVDRKFSIVGATWPDAYDAATKTTGAKVRFNTSQIIEMDTSNTLFAEISYPTDDKGTLATDTIQGHVDVEHGKLMLMSLSGKMTAVEIKGYVSSEAHTWATQVSLEIDTTQVQIGSAEHVEATFPVEFLQDVKAMYNVDGQAQTVDQMSQLVAQKVDLNIIQFLKDQYEGTNYQFSQKFDVYPSSDFALGATEWRKQLRSLIDFQTQQVRQNFKDYDAKFVIVGNPLDTMLLPDVDWNFQSGEGEVGGVGISYQIGAISGVASYKIISSDLMDQGMLYVVGIPQRSDFKSFMYYPYTFNVVSNYNNSVNTSLPNIMMTKRYTLEKFTPIIGGVSILHNDGSVYSR